MKLKKSISEAIFPAKTIHEAIKALDKHRKKVLRENNRNLKILLKVLGKKYLHEKLMLELE